MTMSEKTTLIWFRQDLRLEDHPALDAAAERGEQIVPVFIWSPEEEGDWQPGAASRWWLHQSLCSLQEDFLKHRLKLVIRKGDALAELLSLARESGASRIYYNRRYEPVCLVRDKKVEAGLRSEGMKIESFNSHLLFEPWEIQNQSGKPFQVFTPYWKACLRQGVSAEPHATSGKMKAPKKFPQSLSIDDLQLEPRVDWAAGMRECWSPGAKGAEAGLERFLREGLQEYESARNRPDLEGVSRLSPHLHFGEISIRRVWHSVLKAAGKSKKGVLSSGAETFLRELGWREFSYHLLYHYSDTPDQPLRENFKRFPWKKNAPALKAWQEGRTGYPIVDAGMRQLWQTGWMHNRVRMIVASFLVKDLLIAWQEGARWFWDTLVDADLANNTQGWQWTSGCGADAAPYFRIFNPVAQGEKFDPEGDYVRRWVPELAALPVNWIHKPWQAPEEILRQAGITLGKNYALPLVDHSVARNQALKAYEQVKSGS